MTDHHQSIISLLIEKTPSFAFAAMGVVFTFFFMLKIIGFDVAGPINKMADAYAERIEAITDNMTHSMTGFDSSLQRLADLVDRQEKMLVMMERRLNEHEMRLNRLENDSHPPKK